MKCPVCGAAELIRDTRDLSYTYKGETTAIARVTGDFCPACGESILNVAESERVMHAMGAFAIVVLVIGHIGGALYHHVVRRDDTLMRIL